MGKRKSAPEQQPQSASKRKAPASTDLVEIGVDQQDKGSRVVYIGHLPHGFYEDQLHGFFSQFGKITRWRVSRNKKTGKSKHYAFLEFQSPEVAKIASEAMDGYMLFTQKLQCQVMSQDQVHPQLFKGANRKFKVIPWRKIETERANKERTPAQQNARLQRAIKRDRLRLEQIKKAGIDYEYQPLEAALPPQATKSTFDD